MHIESLLCFVAAYVPAVKDVWILGDTFLQKNFHDLTDIKESADQVQSQEEEPYLFRYYNVKLFYAENQVSKNILLRLTENIYRQLSMNVKDCPGSSYSFLTVILCRRLVEMDTLIHMIWKKL